MLIRALQTVALTLGFLLFLPALGFWAMGVALVRVAQSMTRHAK